MRDTSQPKSLFIAMKLEFGFTTQSLSMFIAINIEIGCETQPKSLFNFVNTEIGFHGRGAASAIGPNARLTKGAGSPHLRPAKCGEAPIALNLLHLRHSTARPMRREM